MENTIELVRIPLRNIIVDSDEKSDLINILGLSDFYSLKPSNLNYIPITVISKKNNQFHLIKGLDIYEALLHSNKEWAWALRINSSNEEQYVYELSLKKNKLNICTLGEREFEAVFEYLQQKEKKLSTILVEKLVAEYGNDPNRRFWSSLEILTEFKCGITKLKIPLLSEYFHASPDLTSLKPITPIIINNASEEELFKQIQRLKIEPDNTKLRKVDTIELVRSVASFSDRIYWSSSNHIIKAKVGVSKSLWEILSIGFAFEPAPTPSPNTSRFLLNLLSVKQLREEAISRSISFDGLKKDQLVDLLSTN